MRPAPPAAFPVGTAAFAVWFLGAVAWSPAGMPWWTRLFLGGFALLNAATSGLLYALRRERLLRYKAVAHGGAYAVQRAVTDAMVMEAGNMQQEILDCIIYTEGERDAL